MSVEKLMTIFILLCAASISCCTASEDAIEDDLKCNLKICGGELLNFESFTFTKLFRKLELATFCIKNCTPPVVHEFFQGIIFAITKRIPGHCSGNQCVDKNRFVALAKCVEEKAWPLLQCSKRLIDLAQVGLVLHVSEEKRNTTCSIITETTQCFEEKLQACGEKPFRLTKEIFFDVVKVGINAYCHPAYNKEGLLIKRTTMDPSMEDVSTLLPDHVPDPHPQYVKGYRTNAAITHHALSNVCLIGSLVIGILISLKFQ